MYRIGQFAKLTGVTERTLRYYDKKGLLKPTLRVDGGYRYYSKEDLVQLQKILTMKYLNFSLEDIADTLADEKVSMAEVFDQQHEWLIKKRDELNGIIESLDRIKKITSKVDSISAGFLLLMIHNLQNENKQREHLLMHLPSQIVNVIFQDDQHMEEKLELEMKMVTLLSQILELQQQGISHTSEEAISVGLSLYSMLAELLMKATKNMTEEEKEKLQLFEKDQDALDPALFPSILSKEETDYIDNLMELVDIIYHTQLEQESEQEIRI
ncbi:MAG: MerR family transcriptional regulator [Candidatus Pristimantibacillus lignocellulolyticus]|uniref:MerR family transcriptional regulator n=1 Tax=Candidatus Pristimantibacillus lignocellulolyticus TaxID=2994561 RepID=A0A9J6Z9L3_9BACL|nr:MAG: MerR family transcriptional regulator [Candidatus Pristimantibacillus lignocellulolyticus]